MTADQATQLLQAISDIQYTQIFFSSILIGCLIGIVFWLLAKVG